MFLFFFNLYSYVGGFWNCKFFFKWIFENRDWFIRFFGNILMEILGVGEEGNSE